MISHAQLWLLLFLQISLFIYFNLGYGPIRAKNNENKQTNFEKDVTMITSKDFFLKFLP